MHHIVHAPSIKTAHCSCGRDFTGKGYVTRILAHIQPRPNVSDGYMRIVLVAWLGLASALIFTFISIVGGK